MATRIAYGRVCHGGGVTAFGASRASSSRLASLAGASSAWVVVRCFLELILDETAEMTSPTRSSSSESVADSVEISLSRRRDLFGAGRRRPLVEFFVTRFCTRELPDETLVDGPRLVEVVFDLRLLLASRVAMPWLVADGRLRSFMIALKRL